jgi:lantibiotic transport system ATP-binding protein
METKMVIQTEGLSRSFGKYLAVSDLDLNVPEQVVYGFLGPNGAGKTTTIRMLLGLIRPDAGIIRFFGNAVQSGDWRSLDRVGALVESPSLYPNLTGRENLEVIRRMLNLPRNSIEYVLQIVGLTKETNKLVKHYSLGMQQRLAIAQAMLNQPKLLVLDEPTNGLDPSGIQEIRSLIRDLPRQQGTTVFLSSHLLSEVELIASHVGIIQNGKLRFQGPLAELKQQWGPVLQIEVQHIAEAAALLNQMGWQTTVNNQLLEVRNVPSEKVPEINQLLLQNGFPASQFFMRQAGLEEMFLELTGEKEQDRI